MKIFKGVYTAIVTPFNEDLSIDYDSFSNLVKEQLEAEVDGIIINGTSGESPNLDFDEVKSLVDTASNLALKKTKILVGSGTNSTKESIRRSMVAEKMGADGLLLVNPYYNKPSQEGLYKHFLAISDSVSLPIMLYSIKSRSGVDLEVDTILRLSEKKNIVSVKDANSDVYRLMRLIKETGEDFSVLTGDDFLTYSCMNLGGDGVVSVFSNAFPKELKTMVNLLEQKRYEDALKIHYKMLNLMISLVSISVNPVPIKTVLSIMGKVKETFRLPLTKMEDSEKSKLYKVLDSFMGVLNGFL